MKIRIYFEDTDAGGVVYHTNYLKYCERARSESFWQNGLEVCNDKCGFMVKKILHADFIKPARLGDLIEVTSKVLSYKKTSFVVHHEILKNGEKIFEIDILAVYLCEGKPSRISQKALDFLIENYM